MSSENISLYDLLNLAIGTPQKCAANFGALHSLLLAVLRQLDILDVKARLTDSPPGNRALSYLVDSTGFTEHQHAEGEQSQTQVDVEQDVQPSTELQERTLASSSPTPRSGTGGDGLLSRVQACEDGLTEIMKLIEELRNQKDKMKDEMKDHQQKLLGAQEEMGTVVEKCWALEETVTSLKDSFQKYPDPEQLSQYVTWDTMQSVLLNQTESLQKLLGAQEEMGTVVEKCWALEETVTSLKDTFQKYPDPEQLSQYVTWDTMQSVLLNQTENIQKELVNLRAAGQVTAVGPTNASLESNFTDAKTPYTRAPMSPHSFEHSVMTASTTSPVIAGEISTLQNATGAMEPSLVQSPQQSHFDTDLPVAGIPLSQRSSGSVHYIEPTETQRDIRKLQENFEKLESCLATLQKEKVDHTELKYLRELVANAGSQDVSINLIDQPNQQKASLDSLMSDWEKNTESVTDVQKAILKLQTDCEKLHETTRCLHEDNIQKQSHIEELYRTTEELEEKKADKQMVESEIKADKSVLESKVSRLQFDSATEQLNTMFHELLNKVMGQEQDWHKVINKLSTEMECKLNRIELDSMKKQLEDRWKSIHEKLQAQGAPEHEDAAGLRKQLVDRFHCLSCDRPVVKNTPGPHLVTLPSTPGFPARKSIRPYTVYALDQVRQHYRSLEPGTNCYNFNVANASNTNNDNLDQIHLKDQHERISELADYSHLDMLRSSGGSHVITSSSQRRRGLQYMKHHSQPEVDTIVQSEEFDIVGMDGKIYKGRLEPGAIKNVETKFPTISTKDGMCKTKDKSGGSPPHKPAVSPDIGYSPLVHPPQSARSAQCSRSVSSISGRDWPVSALGCASRSSITQTSAAGESNSELLDNQHISL